MRLDVQTCTAAILAQGPAYLASRTLADFNADAAKQQKAGEHAAAVATYLALFAKAQHANLTHPELYVCHSNCSAAYLKLGLFQEALRHANKCQTLAESSLRRWVGPGSKPRLVVRPAANFAGAWGGVHVAVASNCLPPSCAELPRPLPSCTHAHAGTSRPPPPTSSLSCARARRCWAWG